MIKAMLGWGAFTIVGAAQWCWGSLHCNRLAAHVTLMPNRNEAGRYSIVPGIDHLGIADARSLCLQLRNS